MMQNGFRRIALAQGLLPERPGSPELPANVEPATALRLDAAEAADPPVRARVGNPEMLVADAA
jgi:hypothetical protein